MLKAVGLCCVLLAGGLTGLQLSGQLRRRITRLETLVMLLEEMTSMLRYQAPTVRELLDALCGQARYAQLGFLHTAQATAQPFGAAWQAGLAADRQLTPAERELLQGLGSTLGSTDLEGQLAAIALYRVRLDEQLAGAQAVYARKGRLYRSLGVLGGAMVAVLLA